MAAPETKGTVLYIEDNPDNRLLVKRILLAEEYSLLEAQNAKPVVTEPASEAKSGVEPKAATASK